MLLPEDLVLPRTVTLNFVAASSNALELSSVDTTERRRFSITVYSSLRGDVTDLVEVLCGGLHGGGDLFDFPTGFDSPVVSGKVLYENFVTKYQKPFRHDERTVYTASIEFDVVTTRSG